jgi:hypothetical protein
MMQFKIGDKVRFLNENGEGIIKSFSGKSAQVEIEDGFVIPTMVSELVLVENDNYTASSTSTIANKPAIHAATHPTAPIIGEQGVFLAFEPVEGVFSSNYDMWLVNNTNKIALYSIAVTVGNVDMGLASGKLQAQETVNLQQVSKTYVDTWHSLYLQLLFHQDGLFKPFQPVEKRIEIRTTRLTQLNLLKNIPLLGRQAYSFTVADFKEVQPVTLEMIEQSFANRTLKDKGDVFTPQIRSNGEDKHIRMNKSGYMEVDLHIEELTDNYEGLSNAEIIQIQLKKCRQAIDKALARGNSKIVLIHGVGNGMLKSEVRKLLSGYDGFKSYDAPAERFGYGATEVQMR